MSAASAIRPSTSIGHIALAGMLGLLLLVGVIGGWASTTVIAGAVVSQGNVAVAGRAKQVQHLDGGTVARIEVANGDRVAAGDILLSLDPRLIAVNLDIARTRLAGALALKARLESERSARDHIDFTLPDLPPGALARPLELAGEEASQREIFAARAMSRQSRRDRLTETLKQIDEQIIGGRGQIAALKEQAGYVDAQIATLSGLVNQGLTRLSELNEQRRLRAELAGRLAALTAETARFTIARRDAELETLQAEQTLREEVVTMLRETTGQIEELVLDIVTRQGQLDRLEIRAPVAGVVHEMQITTLGGVVTPGATLLEIVPENEEPIFEIRVEPTGIDEVHLGQNAEIVLAGLDLRTPRLHGRVTTISATTVSDPQTGRTFYRVELKVPPDELKRLSDRAMLVPGMPVETYITTKERTVLSYLVQPILANMRRAFRE